MSTLSPVAQFILDIAIILVFARLLGGVARWLGQPPVIGEILAGILLGPTLFSGKIFNHLFLVANPTKAVPGKLPPPATIDLTANNFGALTAIATVGLVLFMFIVGYEVDRTLFKGRERVAVAVSLGSIALPMIGGTLLGLWLISRHTDITTKHLPSALFIGAAMSVTAFPVLARILTDRGLHRTRLGGLSIASAAVDDISAWTLLAVVVTIVGSEGTSDTWHILLAPAYLLIMFFLVRPLMRWVNTRYQEVGRLTPDLLAIVITVLMLSAFATEWMNVHYIFGAFIMGACMPRENAAELRQAILERLEQISVLVLLPVFFVVSGAHVDLSQIDGRGLVELLAILAVAIGGKFLGAYLGARSVGVGNRQAGALATLMNTRGLTELVILNVGLSLGVLDEKLFSLMVLMALVTTAMTGPILALIYPKRLIDREIADAERAAVSADAGYRVLVVADSLDDVDLVDTAAGIAASHTPAEVMLVHLVPQQRTQRLELGAGLGQGLLAMTQTLSKLHTLATRVGQRDVRTAVHARFSESELAEDLTRLIVEVDPDQVVLAANTQLAPHDLMPRLARQHMATPAGAAEVTVRQHSGGADSAAALRLATELALGRGMRLVVAGERRERIVADLGRHGISAEPGDAGERAVVVDSLPAAGTTLVANARRDDEATTIDDWAGTLSRRGSDPAATTTAATMEVPT